jgi:hypothetical protein
MPGLEWRGRVKDAYVQVVIEAEWGVLVAAISGYPAGGARLFASGGHGC